MPRTDSYCTYCPQRHLFDPTLYHAVIGDLPESESVRFNRKTGGRARASDGPFAGLERKTVYSWQCSCGVSAGSFDEAESEADAMALWRKHRLMVCSYPEATAKISSRISASVSV